MVKSMENGYADSGKKSAKKDVMLDVKSSLISLIDDTPRLLTVWLEDAKENDDGSATVKIFDSLSVEATAVVAQESAKTALALIGKPVSVTICNKGTDCMPEFSVRDIDYDVSGERLGVDPADLYDETVGRLLPMLTAYPGTASVIATSALLNISPLLLKAKDNSEQFDYEGGLLDRMDKTLSAILNVCDNYREIELDKSLLVSGTFFALLSEVYYDCYNGLNMYIPATYKVLGLIDSVAEKLGYDPDGYIMRELKHIASASCDNAAVKPQTIYAKIVREISGLQLNVKSYLDSIPEFITKEED